MGAAVPVRISLLFRAPHREHYFAVWMAWLDWYAVCTSLLHFNQITVLYSKIILLQCFVYYCRCIARLWDRLLLWHSMPQRKLHARRVQTEWAHDALLVNFCKNRVWALNQIKKIVLLLTTYQKSSIGYLIHFTAGCDKTILSTFYNSWNLKQFAFSLITNRNPNSNGELNWPVYTQTEQLYLRLRTKSDAVSG